MKQITKIVVNGREYDSVEQMPPEVREKYLQAIGTLRNAAGGGVSEIPRSGAPAGLVVKETFTYNGREYKSRDELPPEIRSLLDHLPQPGPGDKVTQVEVKSTKVFGPEVRLASQLGAPAARLGLAWRVVAGLVVVVLGLLFLWLSGIKPDDLFKR